MSETISAPTAEPGAAAVSPLPNVTEHLEPGGVNWTMRMPVCRGGIVVEPPTQAFVKLLGVLDVGYWNDVDLELHVDFRCAAIILPLLRAGACLTHMHWLTFLSFVVSLICSC